MFNEVGTDIVPVARIAALVHKGEGRFLERWFTQSEIEYCASKAVPSRHLAARFAAKEAVAKAIPGKWDGPLPWRSIEIVNSATGAPMVVLTGRVRELAAREGVRDIRVSLSHCDEYATAVAMLGIER